MLGPAPDAVWIERYDGRLFASFVPYGWDGKARHRAQRATAILRRVKAGSWSCAWCGDSLPEWRRADAE
ncbi:hypothetical protein SAMN05421539_104146 [Jannaschia seohaensis]|uniref:Uncharacterized protein n=1 Tax=Jannaschia seohaensis TaxID=475081 RepID=A0A2Y9AP60_9RHOB|nr:hypothetical protein BCF38_104146 [Jannaschia seohaensis]SSA45876.1 hypothetical protein SAMN05421539_104146 [Jannaschia seohaensis]